MTASDDLRHALRALKRLSPFWILDDQKRLVRIDMESPDDLKRWADWNTADANRIVAQHDIAPDVWLSTVFLSCGINRDGLRMFETALFEGNSVDVLQRYDTWHQADEGHAVYLYSVKQRYGVK